MNTYYDYLTDRIAASGVRDHAQLEHLIHMERNALWQQMVANPAYDERGRMAALAAFDEAASYILSEQTTPRIARKAAAPSLEPDRPTRAVPAGEPSRTRSLMRDILVFLIGAAVGFAAAYFAGGSLPRLLSGTQPASELGIAGLEPAPKTFKFKRSQPSPLEGEIAVEYASGTPFDSYACEVDTTYRQLLEYARFDDACRTVAFKFLPLTDLWANFNYLEGYMVFSATIMSPAGKKWQGSASVYFSIDGTT